MAAVDGDYGASEALVVHKGMPRRPWMVLSAPPRSYIGGPMGVTDGMFVNMLGRGR